MSSYLIEITAGVLSRPIRGPAAPGRRDQGSGWDEGHRHLDGGAALGWAFRSMASPNRSSHGPSRATTICAPSRADAAGPRPHPQVPDKEAFIEDVRQALWASKVVAYSQGFDEIRTGGVEFGWNINVADCAKIWRDGCIIRAKLLENIRQEYSTDPDLVSLMAAPSIAPKLAEYNDAWRRVVASAAQAGVSAPVFSSSLAYYDMARAPRNNAAVTQGLRDYFGSHTYERVDQPGHFHLDWSGDRSSEDLERLSPRPIGRVADNHYRRFPSGNRPVAVSVCELTGWSVAFPAPPGISGKGRLAGLIG